MERDREGEGVEERRVVAGGMREGGGRVTLSVRRAWCGHAVGEDRERGGRGMGVAVRSECAGCFLASPRWKRE